ncbi:hypothetical protein J437_LFUL001097, partial [Ladona fulva]
MSKISKNHLKHDSNIVEVKTKFDAEFRRFSLKRDEAIPAPAPGTGNGSTPTTASPTPTSAVGKFEEFRSLVERLHNLADTPFLLSYTDPKDGDLLPINNDDNFWRAVQNARPLLRVIVQRRGERFSSEDGGFPRFLTRLRHVSKFTSEAVDSPQKPPDTSFSFWN